MPPTRGFCWQSRAVKIKKRDFSFFLSNWAHSYQQVVDSVKPDLFTQRERNILPRHLLPDKIQLLTSNQQLSPKGFVWRHQSPWRKAKWRDWNSSLSLWSSIFPAFCAQKCLTSEIAKIWKLVKNSRKRNLCEKFMSHCSSRASLSQVLEPGKPMTLSASIEIYKNGLQADKQTNYTNAWSVTPAVEACCRPDNDWNWCRGVFYTIISYGNAAKWRLLNSCE